MLSKDEDKDTIYPSVLCSAAPSVYVTVKVCVAYVWRRDGKINKNVRVGQTGLS